MHACGCQVRIHSWAARTPQLPESISKRVPTTSNRVPSTTLNSISRRLRGTRQGECPYVDTFLATLLCIYITPKCSPEQIMALSLIRAKSLQYGNSQLRFLSSISTMKVIITLFICVLKSIHYWSFAERAV